MREAGAGRAGAISICLAALIRHKPSTAFHAHEALVGRHDAVLHVGIFDPRGSAASDLGPRPRTTLAHAKQLDLPPITFALWGGHMVCSDTSSLLMENMEDIGTSIAKKDSTCLGLTCWAELGGARRASALLPLCGRL